MENRSNPWIAPYWSSTFFWKLINNIHVFTDILCKNGHTNIRRTAQNKQGKSEGFDSCSQPSNLKLDLNHRFLSTCDLEIWWMTSKNNRAPLQYYIKLCPSFQSHEWIPTEVTVRKRSIRVKIGDFLSRVTLKFNGWHWKTIGHLFFTTSSFVHHFKAMG